jgi:hypothetical protein
MKGWTVTLVAALFALAAKDANCKFAIVAILPALCFWGLDAYYLRQERLFRLLYNESFVQDSKVPVYSMNTNECAGSVDSWSKTMFVGVTGIFHVPVLLAVVAAIFMI